MKATLIAGLLFLALQFGSEPSRPMALAGGALIEPAAAMAAPTQARRFELSDLAKLVRVTDPQLAPDSQAIVVVVSRPNYDDNRWENELVLIDVATEVQRVLTHERRGVSQPRWSPVGGWLAFLATVGSGKEAKPQLFVMPMNGGDAKRITSAPNGVQHYAWRPNGQEIAFATADEPEPKKGVDKHNDAFEVGNNDFLAAAAPTSSHIWLVAADGGQARRLTSGAWSLPVHQPPGPPAPPLSWSPDGQSLVFIQQARPHFGDADQSAVHILDVATGAIRPLTGRTSFERFASFSPDGSRIAYWYPRNGDLSNVNEIHVALAAGGEGTSLTRALDRNLVRSIWTSDGQALLVGGHDNTRVSLWLQPLDGAGRRLDLGNVSPAWSFWVDMSLGKDGAIAFTGREPQRPTELYYLASPSSPPRRLTDFNGEVAAMALGKVETIAWEGPDGFHEDGVLTYPPDFAPGHTYPLVLSIHGGPRAASTEAFSARAQLMAAHGYVVFEPNYRGSDNRGNAYQRAILNDAGDGPGRDVMAGLDAVTKRGFVDTTRMAVSGWSYGGYMTTWLIGHAQGWKAAVIGAAVTDLLDQYNLGDFNIRWRHAFGGSPWVGDFEKAYREQSPITYAGKIRTPTLILATTGDARVPAVQSYKLYHALRDNGVPTTFIAYPVAGHFPRDPVRAQDVERRWLEWLDQYLGQPTARGN
jgi:dipeptidyl aminopeptidase/acylaminoacyl peptidase